MKKRFLSMLLVLVMVIGMIPFSALSASAAEGKTNIGKVDIIVPALIGEKLPMLTQFEFKEIAGIPSAQFVEFYATDPSGELVW